MLRRSLGKDTLAQIWNIANNAALPIAPRVAALYTYQLALGTSAAEGLLALRKDAALTSSALRAVGDIAQPAHLTTLLPYLAAADARVRKEAAIAIARAHGLSGVFADGGTPEPAKIARDGIQNTAAALVRLLADADIAVAHVAFQILRQLGETAPLFAILDDSESSMALA